MGKNKIADYVNLAITTTMGMLGALTGDVVLQTIAFLPAVVQRLYIDCTDKAATAQGLVGDDYKSLVKNTCESTQNVLNATSTQKANLFRYSVARIEISLENLSSLSELLDTISRDIDHEAYAEASALTSKDVNEIALAFADCFISELENFPRLQHYFFRMTLVNHEARISALEDEKINAANSPYILPENISDDTQYFYDKFEEPLFLHRAMPESGRITLKDVYTLPGATIDKRHQWNEILRGKEHKDADTYYDCITEAIIAFIEHKGHKPGDFAVDILFLEGKAAMGKSSLISWLCWNYMDENRKHTVKECIGERRLVAIKLRDIPRSLNGTLNIQSPFLQLGAYLLNIEETALQSMPQWENMVEKCFSNTLLVLEGFDELCMVESVVGSGKKQYFQNIHNALERMNCNCKILVTSRPEYLDVESLDFPKAHVTISPFSKRNRKEWLERYERLCQVPDDMRKMLMQETIPLLDGIGDSPLTLYMIVARNIKITKNSTLWTIYHDIFAKEIFARDYERGSPHAINSYRELLYRLTAEIANAVSQERRLYVTVDRLLGIKQIRTLLDLLLDDQSNSVKSILEDCFGLASYFRISEKTDAAGKLVSAVEFYHNNIRDYFYCEYIWFHLEEIYSNLPDSAQERDEWFLRSFQELFQYSVYLKDGGEGTRAKPLDFLESKIRHLKEEGRQADFICQEMKHHYFEHFFGKMLQTGFLYCYNYTGNESITDMMTCIYSSVIAIYHTIYLACLEDSEQMAIAEENLVVDIGTSFIFRMLVVTSNIHDLSRIMFDGIMFSGIEFSRYNFNRSSFRQCLMIGCVFDRCDLRGADFSMSSLQNADFRTALIDETTTFSKDTEFGNTKISPEQLSYFAPWVGESFIYADIDRVTYIAPRQEE